jgi:hypothetical protein
MFGTFALGSTDEVIEGHFLQAEETLCLWIRAILMNHLYHHRGQLSVYLRLLDVPVPSIYGPSADENPFA